MAELRKQKPDPLQISEDEVQRFAEEVMRQMLAPPPATHPKKQPRKRKK